MTSNSNPISPDIEGLEYNYPAEWNACVTIKKDKKDKVPPAEVSLEHPGETVIAA